MVLTLSLVRYAVAGALRDRWCVTLSLVRYAIAGALRYR